LVVSCTSRQPAQSFDDAVKKHQLPNVEFVLGRERRFGCRPKSLDLVLIANAYYEFTTAVNRSSKTDGRLVVVEYSEEHLFEPRDNTERITVDQIRAEIEPMGF